MSTEPAAKVWLKQGLAFMAYVWRRLVDERCLGIAATLSYTSLLALVPLAAIVVTVLAAFPVFEGAREGIHGFIFTNFMPDTGERIAEYFTGFIDNAGKLTAIGIAGLVVPASLLLATIGSIFNTIFGVARPRPLLSRLLIYFTVLTLGPLVLGASVLLAANISALAGWAGFDGLTGLLERLSWLVPALIVVLAFSLLYALVPNRSIAWRDAIAGGVVAGILFSTLRFRIVPRPLPDLQDPLWRPGGGADIPGVAYHSWAAGLIGALVAASLSEWREAGPADRR